jgi:hypothetical protein
MFDPGPGTKDLMRRAVAALCTILESATAVRPGVPFWQAIGDKVRRCLRPGKQVCADRRGFVLQCIVMNGAPWNSLSSFCIGTRILDSRLANFLKRSLLQRPYLPRGESSITPVLIAQSQLTRRYVL